MFISYDSGFTVKMRERERYCDMNEHFCNYAMVKVESHYGCSIREIVDLSIQMLDASFVVFPCFFFVSLFPNTFFGPVLFLYIYIFVS